MKFSASHSLAARAKSAAVPPRAQSVPIALHPVRLELPYPPSVNTLYRSRAVGGRAFPRKTDAHRDYVAAVGCAVGVVTPWPKDVNLSLTVRLYRPRKSGDIDGPLKALFDALNGRAWVDDSQIIDLHVQRRDDKHRPRVELEIQPAAPEETP